MISFNFDKNHKKKPNKESVICLHKEIKAHQNKCMLSSLNCMSKAAR